MEILINILIILAVILVFNFVIFIHELGHFLAGKWRGMYIDRFQIWFGKPIWKKTIGGVQYGLGWLPFGGFVSLPQMADMESIEGRVPEEVKGTLKPVKPIDKIIVAFAGPLFSFLLAVVAAVVVWMVGVPDNKYETTTIGYVHQDYAAAGKLKEGDKILEVEGVKTDFWVGNPPQNGVVFNIAISDGDTVDFLVERDGEVIEIQTGFTIPDTHLLKRKAHRKVGIQFESDVIVGETMEHSPARLADLKEGDRVLTVNGVKPWSVQQFIDMVKGKDLLDLEIDRDGEVLKKSVVMAKPVNRDEKKLGMGFSDENRFVNLELVYRDPLTQIQNHLELMWITISKVASPNNDIGAQQLNGPVGISMAYFDMLKSEHGWRLILSFTVLLNVNLAILNLLPLPVLDGGHIVMSFYEMLMKKPIPTRILAAVQSSFVLLLLCFMLFITSKDTFDRWLNDGVEEVKPEEPMYFAAPD